MKTSNFVYVFLTREMLVQLVNFENCHSPLRLWLSPTGTVSIRSAIFESYFRAVVESFLGAVIKSYQNLITGTLIGGNMA
jgi:hypothetical protein